MTAGGKPTILRAEADQTIAASSSSLFGGRQAEGRKVRAPQGRVPGNAWGAQAHDQCNREQTADGPRKRDQVRVKGCGKSAPRGW
ncbi:hypothetical protein EB105725_14_00550 [Shimwellia blattae DSM 4481 = NBRC 105725]|nr:hypothetical protein EB105725_14_00550 [Shimwellia blattae DSM 4481 = NBRC 105725]